MPNTPTPVPTTVVETGAICKEEPAPEAPVLAAGWVPVAGATGADVCGGVVMSALRIAASPAGAVLAAVGDCIHGAAGSSGIFHAGRMTTSAGMAIWPITAAVQTA